MTEPDLKSLVHIADGYLLVMGHQKHWLHNVASKSFEKIDFTAAACIEHFCLGAPLRDLGETLPAWLKKQLLVPGPAVVDPLIRSRLEELDNIFSPLFYPGLSKKERHAYELTLDAHARRKRLWESVGQCPVLPETALRRALWVGDSEKHGKKRIVCIGDDDLLSIPLAVLGHEITVLEIDPVLTKLIEQIAQDSSLSITVEKIDLRQPLTPERIEQYDLFVADPMSNRACFELFVSRGLSLIGPEGGGYCAVRNRSGRLFHTVAAELGVKIDHWSRRHNHYYGARLCLHAYESDWVKISKTAKTHCNPAANEYRNSPNLYREAGGRLLPFGFTIIHDIDETRLLTPLFLENVIDTLEQTTRLESRERSLHAAQDWTLVHASTADGHLSLLADRKRRRLLVNMWPHDVEVSNTLQTLLMTLYKRNPKRLVTTTGRDLFDTRIS